MPKKKSILFFETFSFAQVFFLIPLIREADQIFFHKKIMPESAARPLYLKIKKPLMRLISLIHSKAHIQDVSDSIARQYNWKMNKKAVLLTDRCRDSLRTSPICQTLIRILDDSDSVKFFQSKLIGDVASRLTFFAVAKHLSDSYGDTTKVWMIPSNSENAIFEEGLFDAENLWENIPKHLPWINSLRLFAIKYFWLFFMWFWPLIFVVTFLRRIRWTEFRRPSYEVLMSVAYGVFRGTKVRLGTKRVHDDAYLYHENLPPGKIVHLFDKWPFARNVEKECKEAMREKGFAYCDIKELYLTVPFLKRIFSLEKILTAEMIKNRFYVRGSPYYLCFASAVAIHGIVEKYLQFENLDYKVEFIKDDYNAKHIVTSILSHKNGRKTVGIQHHVNAYDCPSLHYVHFDRYITFGDLLEKSFSPHWDHLKLERTGRRNIDWMVHLLQDSEKMISLQNTIQKQYGKRKYIATIILPTGYYINSEHAWEELYQGLQLLKKESLNFHLFLRFKTQSDLKQYNQLQRFVELAQTDSRFIVDHQMFTTYELLAISDLVIAPTASFSIWESLVKPAKVFSFDFIGTAAQYFPDYGKDFILKTREDFIRTIRGLETHFEGFDCQWDRLREDCNYHYDGKNLERIQKVIMETLQEMDHPPQQKINPAASLTKVA